MKACVQLKKPYGKGFFARVRHACYLGSEDAFDVEFENGLGFMKPNATARNAKLVTTKPIPVSVAADTDPGSHFTVTCDNGQVAEVSWSFICEVPPKK